MTLLAGLLVAVGIVGILLPLLPGLILVLAGIAVWAIPRGDQLGWTVFGIAAAIIVIGSVAKYLLPGRRMKESGVPTRSIVVGAGLGIVGFFVIPVVGALVGFPVGIYVAERVRVGADGAWPSTKAALRAVGVSILIELAAAVAATLVWVAGVALT